MTTLEVDDDFDLPDCVPVADCDDLTRDEWLVLRRAGLGGSDASTVCGLNDFASPYVLWLDKTGILPDCGVPTCPACKRFAGERIRERARAGP